MNTKHLSQAITRVYKSIKERLNMDFVKDNLSWTHLAQSQGSIFVIKVTVILVGKLVTNYNYCHVLHKSF